MDLTTPGFAPTLILLVPLLPAAMVPVILLGARRLGPSSGWLAAAAAAASFALLAWVGFSGTPVRVSIPWIPSLGLELTFLSDGLALFYGLIICGIGFLVCWYAVGYLADDEPHGRFHAYILMFMAAMLATVLSDNLLTLFVFWELTGIASFLLIGFHHTRPEASSGARRALLVTFATGLCMLTGIIMLGVAADTFSLTDLISRGGEAAVGPGRGQAWLTASMLLILMGAFGKSAQFPFHFWLPGAMAAPTPVSTYLHAATMVKLGVFLTARIFPVFGHLDLWFPILAVVCFTTMLLGAWLALMSHDLKAILAYSTVSQLGFLMGLYGLFGGSLVRFDFVHVLSHVCYKGALFMVAGVVDHSTGVRDVRRLGGLGRKLPWTMAACAIAAATMAGLPPTAGFISKELMLTQLIGMGRDGSVGAWVLLAMVGLSAILMAAFAARIFIEVFLGQEPSEIRVHPASWSLQAPPLLLAAIALAAGLFPGQLQGWLDRLAVPGLHAAEAPALRAWHGFTPELFTSVFIFAAGGALYFAGRQTRWTHSAIPRWLRFDVFFEQAHDKLVTGARRLTLALRADWPPAYLPIVITVLLIVPGLALFMHGPIRHSLAGLPIAIHPVRILLVILTIVALLGVLFLRRWSAQLVALSIAGFLTTFYYVLYRAPDLAMTQILVESASVVMILLLLSRFPSSAQRGVQFDFGFETRHFFRIGLSLGTGLLMAALIVFADLNRHPDPLGPRILELSQPLAAGDNAVNTILVDFRGFDTLGEITVLLTATLGVLGLMMRYRRRIKLDPKAPPGFLLGRREQP